MLTMLFYIDRDDAPKQKAPESKGEKPVSGVLALLVCIAVVAVSGYTSLKLTDPDQGKTVTAAEVKIRLQKEAERIANHPNMPPQAKAMALRALQTGRYAVPYLR